MFNSAMVAICELQKIAVAVWLLTLGKAWAQANMACMTLRPPPLAPRGNNLSLYVIDLPFGRAFIFNLLKALFISGPRHRLNKGLVY